MIMNVNREKVEDYNNICMMIRFQYPWWAANFLTRELMDLFLVTNSEIIKIKLSYLIMRMIKFNKLNEKS